MTFLAGATFLHTSTSARPAVSTRLRQDDLSMRSQLLTRAKESTFFAYELTRDNFSPYKRDLSKHFRFV